MIRSDEVSLIVPLLVLLTVVAIAFFLFTRGSTLGGGSTQTVEPRPENVTVRLLTADGALTDPITVPGVIKTEQGWRARLTPEQYAVARLRATERPFSGIYTITTREASTLVSAVGFPFLHRMRSSTRAQVGQVSPVR